MKWDVTIIFTKELTNIVIDTLVSYESIFE